METTFSPPPPAVQRAGGAPAPRQLPAGNGWSFWATPRTTKGLEGLFRYDSLKPNKTVDARRNTFRASNYLLLDLALIKNFTLTERQRLLFRLDAFNFVDRANFAIPIRYAVTLLQHAGWKPEEPEKDATANTNAAS